MCRRALIEEAAIARAAELAHDVGLSLRILVDETGETSFSAAGVGSFDDLLAFERALADLSQVPS